MEQVNIDKEGKLKKLALLLVVAMVGLISSCGGGGGGGGTPAGGGGGLTYVGITAPVTFTPQNYTGASNEFMNHHNPSDFIIGTTGSLAPARAARRIAVSMPSSIKSATRNASTRASETYSGNISGSITYSGTNPVLGSNYTYTVTFSNYADTVDTSGLIFNGVISVSGIESVVGTSYTLSETYQIGSGFSVVMQGVNGFTALASGTGSYNVSGSNAFVLNGSVNYTSVMENFTYNDFVFNFGSDYIRLENYVASLDWTNSGAITLNGNIYYSNYGLVVVETISPIGYGSGTLHLHGMNNTSVKLVFGWTSCTASLEIGDDIPPAFDDGTVVLAL